MTRPTCCNHNCAQGRACPNRAGRPMPRWIIALMAALVLLLSYWGKP